MTHVTRFEGIRKSYGDHPALRGVSLDVERGEVFGLLGPNGAGKTSLIRILMDIIRADDGSIEVFGERHHRGLLDRIGYLPEERGLYQKSKVRDVMTYFGSMKGLRKAEAVERSKRWLEKIGMPEVFDKQIQSLSKGMTQKVQIAATLLTEPELVVLDEPFSGLDPVNVELVRELIDERRRDGRTTILSTHQMNMVEAVCDRVALIHRGARVLYGRVSEVRETHSPPQVEVRADGPIPPSDSVASSEARPDGTVRLRLHDGVEPQQLLAELVSRGARVQEYRRVLASMQEIFVRVAGSDALEEHAA